MGDQYERSGMIPAFGDWDRANELPITQYFQCARQAGLVRYSSSSGEGEPCNERGNLYAVDYNKMVRPHRKLTSERERERGKRFPNAKKSSHPHPIKKGEKGIDATEPPRKLQIGKTVATASKNLHQNDIAVRPRAVFGSSTASDRPLHAKPVDGDLYKIPPQLLHNSKRKKMLGFFSRCLVPAACVS